jgi:hypothetical protein
VRLEHTIWKAALLLLEEDLAERVVHQESLNFLHWAEIIKEFETLGIELSFFRATQSSKHLFLLRINKSSLVSFIVVGGIRVIVLLRLIIKVNR